MSEISIINLATFCWLVQAMKQPEVKGSHVDFGGDDTTDRLLIVLMVLLWRSKTAAMNLLISQAPAIRKLVSVADQPQKSCR